MSLLQYGFEHKRVNKDDSSNDEFSDRDKDNYNKNVKKPQINNIKTFKLQ